MEGETRDKLNIITTGVEKYGCDPDTTRLIDELAARLAPEQYTPSVKAMRVLSVAATGGNRDTSPAAMLVSDPYLFRWFAEEFVVSCRLTDLVRQCADVCTAGCAMSIKVCDEIELRSNQCARGFVMTGGIAELRRLLEGGCSNVPMADLTQAIAAELSGLHAASRAGRALRDGVLTVLYAAASPRPTPGAQNVANVLYWLVYHCKDAMCASDVFTTLSILDRCWRFLSHGAGNRHAVLLRTIVDYMMKMQQESRCTKAFQTACYMAIYSVVCGGGDGELIDVIATTIGRAPAPETLALAFAGNVATPAALCYLSEMLEHMPFIAGMPPLVSKAIRRTLIQSANPVSGRVLAMLTDHAEPSAALVEALCTAVVGLPATEMAVLLPTLARHVQADCVHEIIWAVGRCAKSVPDSPDVDAACVECTTRCSALAEYVRDDILGDDDIDTGYLMAILGRTEDVCLAERCCAVIAEIGLVGDGYPGAVRAAARRFPGSANIAACLVSLEGGDASVSHRAAAALAAHACTGSGPLAGVLLIQDVYECVNCSPEAQWAPNPRMCQACFIADHLGHAATVSRYPWSCEVGAAAPPTVFATTGDMPGLEKLAAEKLAAVADGGGNGDGPPPAKRSCPEKK